jgi:transposase InsO family protein
VLDVYSRRIVGGSIADHIRSELVVDALQMARWNRQPKPGTILHSDRGAVYTSWIFDHRLREAGLLGSMGRVASSVDNTMMESFRSTMQRELLDRQQWATRDDPPRRSSNGSKASTTPSADTPASTDTPRFSSEPGRHRCHRLTVGDHRPHRLIPLLSHRQLPHEPGVSPINRSSRNPSAETLSPINRRPNGEASTEVIH